MLQSGVRLKWVIRKEHGQSAPQKYSLVLRIIMCSNENTHYKVYPEILCAMLLSAKQREKHQFAKGEFLMQEKQISKIEFAEHLLLENEIPSLVDLCVSTPQTRFQESSTFGVHRRSYIIFCCCKNLLLFFKF